MKMKIVIGYPDAKGRGKVIPLGGPEVSEAEKIKLFFAAKQQHRFPKGVRRMEMLDATVQEIAIFIGDHVAEERADFEEAREKREARAKEERKAEAKRRADIALAGKAVSEAAVKRAQAQSAQIAAEQRLQTANASQNKGLVGQEGTRAAAARKAFEEADLAWQKAKAKLSELQNPKPEPEPAGAEI